MSYEKRGLPIGSRFGKLTILNELPSNEKCRRYVYCECECGSKKVIRYDSLKSGRIKSCGCLLSVKNKSQIEKMVITRKRNKEKVVASEYIGKTFGKLKVKNIYHHHKYKGTWFVLDCECGKKVKASLAKLKIGHVRSCGCIRKKYQQTFVSEIDSERILISIGKLRYARIIETKELLHIHEAKKLFSMKNKEWNDDFVVHHIDGNKLNNRLDNLAIIDGNGKHHKHHAQMAYAMYEFISKNNLLDAFYNTNPNLKLVRLVDLI